MCKERENRDRTGDLQHRGVDSSHMNLQLDFDFNTSDLLLQLGFSLLTCNDVISFPSPKITIYVLRKCATNEFFISLMTDIC